MTGLGTFPPLQATIAHAASWRTYLDACHDELRGLHAQDIIARGENTVGIGVQLGESLRITWRAAFHFLFRPRLASWNSVKDFEDFHKEIRALFYTVREAMDSALKTAERFQALSGGQLTGMDRLLKLLEEARDLEDNVFRDWPSFVESSLLADSLSVDESLAHALGITAEQARQKMDARRQQLNARPE